MKTNGGVKTTRREFLRAAGTAAAGLAVGALSYAARAAGSADAGLKIGIVGSGRLGGTRGALWLKAGHEIMFSSLDLEHDKALAARLVREIGFEPVVVGPLAMGKYLIPGTPLAGVHTPEKIRQIAATLN